MEIRFRPRMKRLMDLEGISDVRELPDETVLWRVFTDAFGLSSFAEESACDIAFSLVDRGHEVQVWRGDVLYYEVPEYKPNRKITGDGELAHDPPVSAERFALNLRTKTLLDRFRYLRGEREFDTDEREFDALGSAQQQFHCLIQDSGFIPEPLKGDNYCHAWEPRLEEIRRALSITPMQLFLSFAFRALSEPDEARAAEEHDRAAYWLKRAEEEAGGGLWVNLAAQVMTCATCGEAADQCIRARWEDAKTTPETIGLAVCAKCISDFWGRSGCLVPIGEAPTQTRAGFSTLSHPCLDVSDEQGWQAEQAGECAAYVSWEMVRPYGLLVPFATERGKRPKFLRDAGIHYFFVREVEGGKEYTAIREDTESPSVRESGSLLFTFTRWNRRRAKETQKVYLERVATFHVRHDEEPSLKGLARLSLLSRLEEPEREASEWEALCEEHQILFTFGPEGMKQTPYGARCEERLRRERAEQGETRAKDDRNADETTDAPGTEGRKESPVEWTGSEELTRLVEEHRIKSVHDQQGKFIITPYGDRLLNEAEARRKAAAEPDPTTDTPGDPRQEDDTTHERESHATVFYREGSEAGPDGPADRDLPADRADDARSPSERLPE